MNVSQLFREFAFMQGALAIAVTMMITDVSNVNIIRG